MMKLTSTTATWIQIDIAAWPKLSLHDSIPWIPFIQFCLRPLVLFRNGRNGMIHLMIIQGELKCTEAFTALEKACMILYANKCSDLN